MNLRGTASTYSDTIQCFLYINSGVVDHHSENKVNQISVLKSLKHLNKHSTGMDVEQMPPVSDDGKLPPRKNCSRWWYRPIQLACDPPINKHSRICIRKGSKRREKL